MELRPSEIFYSQDSIMNRFGDYTSHGNTYIGETLDQLLRGHCNVNSIPTISVVKKYGKWYTSDNRRLWVFRKAEELGFLETIDVNETYYLNENKFTTENGGESIRVRGRTPGGSLWISWKPKRPISSCQRSISTSYNLNTSNALYSQRNTSPSYPVSNPTTNHYHQNTSLSNRSSMSSVYSGRSEQRKTYQPPSVPTVPSPTHANTNRVSSPTIINRSTYRNDSSNVDNRQYYTNSTNTRTMETNSPYQSYGRGGSSYQDRSTDRVPSRSSSRQQPRHDSNNKQSFKAERDINKGCCTIL